jgi:hypothetical protein
MSGELQSRVRQLKAVSDLGLEALALKRAPARDAVVAGPSC